MARGVGFVSLLFMYGKRRVVSYRVLFFSLFLNVRYVVVVVAAVVLKQILVWV